MVISFSPYIPQIILCHQQHFSFSENKTKDSGEYAFYLALFLIILNVDYVDIYDLSCININVEKLTYKNHKRFCL